MSLFTEEHLSQKSLKHFFHVMHQMVIEACEPATEFSDSQKEALESYLTRVLHVPNGMRSTFAEFSKSLAQQHLFGFEEFARLSMDMEIVFDPQGNVTSKRADLFLYLTRVISALSKAVFQLRQYVDQISNALQVKSRVLV